MAWRNEGSTRILIAPLMPVPVQLESVCTPVAHAFHSKVAVTAMEVDLSTAYDASRDQHSSTKILASLHDLVPGDVSRVVGVVDVDLFIPILTYVFGEAQLGGTVAVASTFRLREPWLSGGAEMDLVQRRFLQTVLHELGHTVGLRHCRDSSCVMASASGLEMLDEKSEEFCLDCRGAVRELVG